MKRLLTALLVLVLVLGLCATVQATSGLPHMVDEAGLLSESQVQELEQYLADCSEALQFDIVIVTKNRLNSWSIQDEADDFFDYNGYGYGYDRDGILLMVSMETREWAISTSGYGITAFTDRGLEYLESIVQPRLSDGDYYGAFFTFADMSEEFVLEARDGRVYGADSSGELGWAKGALIALVVGLLVALIATGVMKGQLKTVRAQNLADNYVKSGSMQVTEARDMFLYRNVSRRAKPKSSSGSGSRTHRSSSGRSHGGRSGRF